MKKVLALLLALAMVFSFAACGEKKQEAEVKVPAGWEDFKDLVAAAQAEGELVVYGGCEEEYLAAVCNNFQEMFGVKVSFQRLSTSEILAKVQEENGNPSADVSFGGTTDPYNEMVLAGLLEPYNAKNASHLLSDKYKEKKNNWFGIYTGMLGFFYNKDEVARLGIAVPKDFADLTDPQYKGLIWSSNYNTAGTAKLIVNTAIQKYGHDAGIQWLVDLDKNIEVYTKSGSGPSKNVGPAECAIGIGFLHDGITQIVDNGYTNVGLVLPSSGTTCEIGATAMLKGCKHPNAAQLWIEYALSPDCVNLAKENGSYQFLVIDNAEQPKEATEFGLDPSLAMEYDFEDASKNIATYVTEVMNAIAAAGGDTADTRFQTK